MRLSSPLLRTSAALAALNLGVLLPLHATAQGCTTTVQGTVYSPAGPTTGDPIPNILVFAYPTTLPAFPADSGPGGCTAQANLVPQLGILGAGTTDAAGHFVFSTTSAIPANVNIVIQAGKWRRQYPNTAITSCSTNTLPAFTMPANQSQGDLPHIAVVTGAVDGVECIFNQIGISPSEVTTPSGTGSINLYQGDYNGGQVNPDTSTNSPTLPELSLVSSINTMNTYDVIMFGCQGGSGQSDNTAANQANILTYTSNGGRVFTTHYEYIWLVDSFPTVATFGNFTTPNPQTQVATIDQTYPEGAILANWIQNVGASYNNTLGQIQLNNTDRNTSVVHNPPAQSWVNLNSATYGNASMQFTFDTPISATTTPTVAATYANITPVFHPGDPSDTVQINVTNNSSTPTLPGLTLTLSLPSGLTLVSLADASGTPGWVCANSVCTLSSPLGVGATDSLTLKFSISASIPPGPASISTALSGGGLSGTGQCGRVLYNDYHVESQSIGSSAVRYPTACTTGKLTAQEKFLEFSLYNLSNFVSPVSTDTIIIQGITTLAWATPAAIYYGTPLSATQLDATATYNGNAVPGTFTYTPPAGTIEPVGNNTLSATFTPTSTTNYTGGTITTQIQVLQDTTTTTLTSFPNPSNFNQSVAFTATVVGNAAAPTGTVTFYDAGVAIGTGTLAPTGVADTAAAVFNISTLAIGQHNITACYPNTTDFGPSCSPVVVQTVLAPSTTTVTGLTTPIYYGQIIGDTAVITVNGSSTGGNLKVYIDNALVCTLMVVPGVSMTCPPSTGVGYNAGNHTFYAVFSGDAQFSGSQTPTYTVQILPDITQITVASLLNPSIVGQSVTFQATMSGNYATPVGPVTFYDGATAIGTGTLAATSTANIATTSFATSALAVGSHNITVGYAATQNFNAAVSAPPVVQVVNPPPPNNGLPGFGMTVSPTNLSVGVGNTLGISVTIVEYNGFSAPTQLACSGLPVEATCTFVQSTVPAGGGTTTLFISPASPHSCKNDTPDFIAPNPAGGLALLGLAMVLARKRRKLFRGLALAAALMVLPVLQGCGSACLDLGTKPGTYTFTVTGTAAGAQPTPSRTQVVTMNATI
jgi:hypothetical protein